MSYTISHTDNGVKSYRTGNIEIMETGTNDVEKRAKRVPTEADIAFGKRLKEIREMRGYGQEEFAAMVGVDYSQIWRWETGKNEAKRDAIRAIASALEVSIDYLVGVVTEPRGLLADASLSPEERRLIHMLRNGEIKKALNAISQMQGGD